MRRILLAIIAILAFLSAAQAESKIHLNASKILAVLKDNSTVIILPISNFSNQSIKAQATLSWINTDEVEINKTNDSISLPPGHTEIEIPFPLKAPSIWTRLRYSLSPESSDARAFASMSGIVSLAHIATHAFELKLSSLGSISTRAQGQISVFGEAVHPITRIPLSGIEWDATLTLGTEHLKPAQIHILEKGFVEFVFNFSETKDLVEKANIDVVGCLGDFKQTANIEIEISSHISARFQTDKPIYQPGQTIHMRAVILDASGHAAQNEKIALTIQDDDEEDLHSTQLVSSKFGIIQDEWKIPDAATPGTYLIMITAQDDDMWKVVRHSVRVRRYELPTFSVTAKPDQTAYLPGEKTTVTITGTYLFGKPVPKGKVKNS